MKELIKEKIEVYEPKGKTEWFSFITNFDAYIKKWNDYHLNKKHHG